MSDDDDMYFGEQGPTKVRESCMHACMWCVCWTLECVRRVHCASIPVL
jgi:hypothetical protein